MFKNVKQICTVLIYLFIGISLGYINKSDTSCYIIIMQGLVSPDRTMAVKFITFEQHWK